MSTDHLIDRPAQARKCPRCLSRVLVAIDGGFDIAVDPAPLDIRAEAAARITGRYVADIQKHDGHRSYLKYRDIWRVMRPRILPVLAEHECPDGIRPHILWERPGPSARPPPRAPRRRNDSPVPF